MTTTISKSRRQKAATVHVDGKDKFPIDSPHTAKSALKLIHHAKPALTSEQEAAVRRKAASYGVQQPKSAAADSKKKKQQQQQQQQSRAPSSPKSKGKP